MGRPAPAPGGCKADKVREQTETRGHIAVIGDGVNDAPATVGVAMGVAGTAVLGHGLRPSTSNDVD
jgi:cation transport ATPase